jgi:hypothetical protein
MKNLRLRVPHPCDSSYRKGGIPDCPSADLWTLHRGSRQPTVREGREGWGTPHIFGKSIVEFLDTYFAGAASLSFASHSLGARVVLAAVIEMSPPVRRE